MDFESLIIAAADQGASDLHLEPSLPPAQRIRGKLKISGATCEAKQLQSVAKHLVGESNWNQFLERGSFDFSRVIQGVRCRINIFRTVRGVGFAIRLFTSFEATLRRLNLHPELKSFIKPHHGLVIISGPTGSGKSSTLAALIQEINLSEARHIVTVEAPVEYRFRPRQSYIRQREVGRDTPSFEQALIDSLREDPDVLMVGEMREPETMRLTLNAAETGHLVFATVHSSTTTEALQRVIAAFPSDAQSSIRSQLADCLIGVVAQRLRYRETVGLRLPECEILRANHPVKAHLRSGDLFKLQSAIETGAEHGMWTFDRYTRWLERQKEFYTPDQAARERASWEPEDSNEEAELTRPQTTTPSRPPQTPAPSIASPKKHGAIEIEPGVGELGRILRPDSED